MEKLEQYLEIGIEHTVFYLPRVLLAILILWLGLKLVRKFSKLIDMLLQKSNFSDSIRPFLISIVNIILKVTLLFIVAGILGVELSIFATVLAASVFAIGMALQGSLGNFASGLIVLSIYPYKVGDWIEVNDKFGKVEEIGIFNTKIVSPGHKTLVIPNSKITTDVITNFSQKKIIRLELEVTMPYQESFPKVKGIIEDALETIPLIIRTEQVEIGIITFDTHSVRIAVRPYVHPDDYWEVPYSANAAIKKAFSDNNIEMAYSEGIAYGTIGK